ncbi:MAG: motility associated factor glycosyltransferase family protein [Bacillota bacterium]
MEVYIINTKTVPTVVVDGNVFHSKYNPLKEAEAWTKNVLKVADVRKPIYIIGLAAGYHIIQLSKQTNNLTDIIVIEFNSDYYEWFLGSTFMEEINSLSNIQIHSAVSIPDTILKEFYENVNSKNLAIYKGSLRLIPNEYKNLKEMLSDIYTQMNSYVNQLENMNSNFNTNIKLRDPGINEWKNKFVGKDMLLVSAGPSLDKQLGFLKEIYEEEKIVICSVGTSVKALLKSGIIPDLFMITDPNIGTIPQLESVNLPKTPLFYLSTANSTVVCLHKGPRYIVFQEGFNNAEKTAKSRGEDLISTGGSVSTTLLDLMVYLGAGKIGLVGQDLAFTNGVTHASQTPLRMNIANIEKKLEVVGYYRNEKVYTANNLNYYRKWFEKYALRSKSNKLYNCTEGGAYINGWKHVSLREFNKITLFSN